MISSDNMMKAFAVCGLAVWTGLFCGAAMSQQYQPPAPGAELIMLGTVGGPNIRKDRAAPSTLLRVDDRYYLIDVGIGSTRRLTEAGVNINGVRHAFVTHIHPDHTFGLASFMGIAAYTAGFNPPRGVPEGEALYNFYGPPDLARMVDAAADFIAVPLEVFAAERLARKIVKERDFRVHEFTEEGIVFQDDKITVTANENTHYAEMAPEDREKYKSYAYRFETPYGVMVYTGDTTADPDLAEFAKGADVLVSEVMNAEGAKRMMDNVARATKMPDRQKDAILHHIINTHLLPAQIAELANAAGVKSIVLNHFGPGLDNNQAVVEADIAGIRAGGFEGQIIGSRDLDRYCINKESANTVLSACR